MLELKAVAKRVGLSEHQARRVLRGLTPLLQPHIKRGKDNRILVDDSGVAIVERAIELWQGGKPLNRLCAALTEELTTPTSAPADDISNEVSNPEQPALNVHQTGFDPTAELVNVLKFQVERQANEFDTLRNRLADLEDRLPALPATTDSRQRIGRLQALRIAVLGR